MLALRSIYTPFDAELQRPRLNSGSQFVKCPSKNLVIWVEKASVQGLIDQSWQSGFTLVELLVTTVVAGVIFLLIGVGLMPLISASLSNEEETQQRTKLNHALDFMADEIRESQKVVIDAPSWPPIPNCSAIFSVEKPNSLPPVAYYSCVSNGVWQGPRVLYRSESSGSLGAPLVDALANQTPTCTGAGTGSVDNMGIKVRVEMIGANSRSAKLCLKGEQVFSKPFELETQTLARGQS